MKASTGHAHASGRFVLRLPPALHATLRRAAQDAGISLNDFCVRRLALPLGSPSLSTGASEVVGRAAELFGERLVGVIVYGSWARGEAADSSDVDVLVVLSAGARLSRTLYRAWDEKPVRWDGRPVEPHFVVLPPAGERAGAVWAEVALDGLVLLERDLLVSARLVQVRHDILSGRLVRRFAHGQPYWAEVA
ncbi:MAG: toxin-antitoxin system HicB family antitoxin [Candidatus Binatia bacterium]